MNNNFETLKKEVCEVIQNELSYHEKKVINFINIILSNFESELKVRKNMSIGDFKNLICNSSTPEEFKSYLDRLDCSKCYEINTLEEYNDAIQFNEVCKKSNGIESYENYKKFLDSKVKFNENLFVIMYPENKYKSSI